MKKVIKYAAMLIGAAMLNYSAAMFAAEGFGYGLIPLLVFGAALAAYGSFFDKFKSKLVHIVVVCIALGVVSASGALAVYGNNDNVTYNEDAVIVLGKGLNGDEVPPDLAYRLNKAVKYYEKNPDVIIIVSGGKGTDEKISEALAMERYLLSKGISSDKIIKEDKSTSTYENFVFSSEVIPEGSEVAFITNSFHVYRAEKIAASVGIDATHLGADIEWYTVPTNYMRELMVLVKFWITGK